MKKVLGVILGLLVVLYIVGSLSDGSSSSTKSSSSSNKETILKTKLNYLNDIEAISWWEVDDNDVYINFTDLSYNWKAAIRMAATLGNKATDFGVHVWALNGKEKGWRPGDSGYLENVTARYGKLQ